MSSLDAHSWLSTHDDGKHVRTAIVMVGGSRTGGSIDVVTPDGELLVRINMFTNEEFSWFAADVIELDDRFNKRNAITFSDGKRTFSPAMRLVATDFRKE